MSQKHNQIPDAPNEDRQAAA